MSGVILNVTDLNSNANHLYNRQNREINDALDELSVNTIDEKRTEKRVNDAVNTVINSDINSNGNVANELSYTNRSKAEAGTTERRISATESLDSRNRSNSLEHHNHGYDDSSEFDSNTEADSDFDDIVPSPLPNSIHLNKSSSSSIVMMDKNLDGRQSSLMCASSDTSANIGSIAVQNSSDITFGNKTFYQGPVTIKQFVYDKSKWKESETPSSEGTPENDNLHFVNKSTDKLSRTNTGKFQPSNFSKFLQTSSSSSSFFAVYPPQTTLTFFQITFFVDISTLGGLSKLICFHWCRPLTLMFFAFWCYIFAC